MTRDFHRAVHENVYVWGCLLLCNDAWDCLYHFPQINSQTDRQTGAIIRLQLRIKYKPFIFNMWSFLDLVRLWCIMIPSGVALKTLKVSMHWFIHVFVFVFSHNGTKMLKAAKTEDWIFHMDSEHLPLCLKQDWSFKSLDNVIYPQKQLLLRPNCVYWFCR